MINHSVKEFTEALASKTSVPGGGGASALVASIGIALGDMVGEFTVGKKTYADVEDEIKELMERAQELRVELLNCIEEDAVAFEPLSKAYGLPKDAEGRDEILEKCLWDAAAVPMKILILACEAVELQKEFASKGSKLMVSDAATGVAMCRAAIQGAAMNVKVNTRLMKDKDRAEALETEVDRLYEKYTDLADEIFAFVYQR